MISPRLSKSLLENKQVAWMIKPFPDQGSSYEKFICSVPFFFYFIPFSSIPSHFLLFHPFFFYSTTTVISMPNFFFPFLFVFLAIYNWDLETNLYRYWIEAKVLVFKTISLEKSNRLLVPIADYSNWRSMYVDSLMVLKFSRTWLFGTFDYLCIVLKERLTDKDNIYKCFSKCPVWGPRFDRNGHKWLVTLIYFGT